jgi:hypothetical protein
MKKPLTANNQEKRCQRRKKGRNKNFFFMRKTEPQGPGEKEQSSAGFKHGPSPVFNTSMSGNGKHDQSANAEAKQPHGLGCSVGSGTNATSSTHAVP